MTKKLFIFLGVAFILWGYAQKGESASLVSEELLRTGKKYYKKGDYQRAIHELSKAIMVDPENTKALDYLNKMGVQEGLYGPKDTQFEQLTEMAQDLQEYQQIITKMAAENTEQAQLTNILEEDKDHLQQLVFTKEVENDFLRQNVSQAKREAKELVHKDREVIENLEKTSRRKTEQIAKLNNDLFKMKDDVISNADVIRQKKKQLRELKQDTRKSERQWQREQLNYEREILLGERKFNNYKHQTAVRDNMQLSQIRQLRDTLREARQELGSMQDDLLLTNYKLSDKDVLIVDKNRELVKLRNTLSSLDGKLTRLDNNFWDRVGDLGAASSAAGRVTAPTGSVSAIDEQLLNRQDRLIVDLKDRLLRARQQINMIQEVDGPVLSTTIQELNQKISQLQNQINDKEAELVRKDTDNVLLDERLQDTQQRLVIVEGMMEEKEAQIKELEDQLTEFLNGFDDLDAKLEDLE